MARCLLPFPWPWRRLRTPQAIVRHAGAEYPVDNGLKRGSPCRQPSIDLGIRGSAMQLNAPAQVDLAARARCHPVIQTQGPGIRVAQTVRRLLGCRSAVAAASMLDPETTHLPTRAGEAAQPSGACMRAARCWPTTPMARCTRTGLQMRAGNVSGLRVSLPAPSTEGGRSAVSIVRRSPRPRLLVARGAVMRVASLLATRRVLAAAGRCSSVFHSLNPGFPVTRAR